MSISSEIYKRMESRLPGSTYDAVRLALTELVNRSRLLGLAEAHGTEEAAKEHPKVIDQVERVVTYVQAVDDELVSPESMPDGVMERWALRLEREWTRRREEQLEVFASHERLLQWGDEKLRFERAEDTGGFVAQLPIDAEVHIDIEWPRLAWQASLYHIDADIDLYATGETPQAAVTQLQAELLATYGLRAASEDEE